MRWVVVRCSHLQQQLVLPSSRTRVHSFCPAAFTLAVFDWQYSAVRPQLSIWHEKQRGKYDNAMQSHLRSSLSHFFLFSSVAIKDTFGRGDLDALYALFNRGALRRQPAREVGQPNVHHIVHHLDLARDGRLHVAAGFGRQIDDHTAGLHRFYHFFRDETDGKRESDRENERLTTCLVEFRCACCVQCCTQTVVSKFQLAQNTRTQLARNLQRRLFARDERGRNDHVHLLALLRKQCHLRLDKLLAHLLTG